MKEVAQQCPCCQGSTHTYSVPTWTDDGIKYTYFLSCIDCGYGPNVAQDTEREAIVCWNNQALEQAVT